MMRFFFVFHFPMATVKNPKSAFFFFIEFIKYLWKVKKKGNC